jgi:hypothetical protein
VGGRENPMIVYQTSATHFIIVVSYLDYDQRLPREFVWRSFLSTNNLVAFRV